MSHLEQQIAELSPEKRKLVELLLSAEKEKSAVPLTPLEYWYLGLNLTPPYHWYIITFLEVKQAPEAAVLEQAVTHVLLRHEALRLCLEPHPDGWRQFIRAPAGKAPLIWVDLSALPKADQTSAIQMAGAQLQTGLNPFTGLVFQVAFFHRGVGTSGRLQIAVHHLVCDGFGLRIILEDLLAAYEQLRRGQPVQLPPPTTSLGDWAGRVIEQARSPAAQAEARYWLSLPWEKVVPLPLDYPDGRRFNFQGETTHVLSTALSVEETRTLLRRVPEAGRFQAMEVLLTAVALAFRQWTGSPVLLTDVMEHGRVTIFNEVDLSHTVGCVAELRLRFLNLEGADTPLAALRAIKEQLRHVPRDGVGYHMLCYAGGETEITRQLRALPRRELLFNYQGLYGLGEGGPLGIRPAPENVGLVPNPEHIRDCLLECHLRSVRQQLQVDWTYSKNVYRPATIERLAQNFLAAVRSLLEAAVC